DVGQLIRLFPQHQPNYLRRAGIWEKANNLDAAIADYSEAIRLSRDKNEKENSYSGRAQVWVKMKNFDRAIDDYDELISNIILTGYLEPRGDAWASKGEFDKAIADYTEYVQRYGYNSVVGLKRAQAYEQKGDIAKARSEYEIIISAPVRLNVSDVAKKLA